MASEDIERFVLAHSAKHDELQMAGDVFSPSWTYRWIASNSDADPTPASPPRVLGWDRYGMDDRGVAVHRSLERKYNAVSAGRDSEIWVRSAGPADALAVGSVGHQGLQPFGLTGL